MTRAAGQNQSPAPALNDAAPAIERAVLDGARRTAQLPVAEVNAPWSACAAPSSVLVVDGDGALRACDFGALALATLPDPAPGDGAIELARRWTEGAFARLRALLADGRLPQQHCRGCSAWLSDELFACAPPLRDYGELPVAAAPTAPRHLVVRLPADGRPLRDDLVAAIAPLLPALATVTLDVPGHAGPEAAVQLLAALRTARPRPRLTLRVHEPGHAPAAVRQFEGIEVETIELTLSGDDDARLAAAVALAGALGATLRARFVLTPAGWFEFEDAARRCAAHDVPLDLRVLDHDGRVPLAALPVEALTFVKDVVSSCWPRCGGERQPKSLARHAFDRVLLELRHVLWQRTEAALRDDAGPAVAPDVVPLGLPAPDHPWCRDASRRAWWYEQLFGRAELPAIREWVVATATATDDALDGADATWLRVLAHRLAWERRIVPLLERLRALYEPVKQRKALIDADTAFAAQFDLRPFGGPWAEQLGLVHGRARRRPFSIGKPPPMVADEAPDVTVLIPSFRHEAYIAETLRSVLAQRHTNFRVLVVDDRSPDRTAEVAAATGDPRVEVRVNDANLGLGNSVLRALDAIDTPYVALLNSDDLFHPDRLARCCAVLDERPEVNLVTTGVVLVDHDGGQLTPRNASLVLDGQQVFDWVHWFERVTPPDALPEDRLFVELLQRNFLVTSSNLVARTDWLRAQAAGLRSLKYCLDWQLFLEAALENALHHVHEPLIAYRLHATNTVWFREGRRWSYYLEVNRVAAEALQRFVARCPLPPAVKLERVVEAVAVHLAANSETDGLALFLNAALDALQLDAAATTSTDVQALVQRLNAAAERVRQAHQHLADAPPAAQARTAAYRHLLGDLAQERVAAERGERRWLQGYAETLETRLRDCWSGRERLEAEKLDLQQEQGRLLQRSRELEAERQRLREQFEAGVLHAAELEQQLAVLRNDLEATRGAAAAIAALRELIQTELEATRGELTALRAELTTLRTERRDAAARLAAQQSDLDNTRAALLASESRREQLSAALAGESAQVANLTAAKNDLDRQRNDALHRLAAQREEVQRLLATREFRTGNFFWNKMPLGYMSRRGKKWYRRLLDAKDRALMLGSRMMRRKQKSTGTAVVAACWQWPIYSHTFVYQEMLGLTHMGLDVRLFHWDLGDTSQLHAAFRYLYENRTQLQPIWENHQKDKEHFEKTRPGRLRAFLERIAPLSGKSVEELENEPIVVQGCTFARMAELAGARYLHSYFFYDQSFMAMQAAWLLDLPRGVSCYADHMMDDYPWKFVPLHIELADVIVATSARIKRELSAKSGGRYDDKIIVKPNGVDGRRFPAVQRAARRPDEPFEVLSVSRIEPKKGLTYLVEAIALLKQRGHRVIAHVIGSKDPHSKGSVEYSAEFEQSIAQHGVQDQVVLHGMMKQEQMPPIIAKCRAFVAPYIETETGDKDGIPTAMLEALASSLPVVTTDSGSILEVVDDGVEGLVVGQRKSRAFADALQRLIEDPALEQRMAKAARARFDREFDINVTERRLHERIAGFLAAQKQKA